MSLLASPRRWICRRCIETLRYNAQQGSRRRATTWEALSEKSASRTTRPRLEPKTTRTPPIQPSSTSKLSSSKQSAADDNGKSKKKYDPSTNNPALIQTLAPRDPEDDPWHKRKATMATLWTQNLSAQKEARERAARRERLTPKYDPATYTYSPSDWDNEADPTPAQLRHASRFFRMQESTLKWATMRFVTIPRGDAGEVCFIGRSNVGKSSLINAVLDTPGLAHVSANPGRTKSLLAFSTGELAYQGYDKAPIEEGVLAAEEKTMSPGINASGSIKGELVLLDTPGYGKGSHEAWGKEIIKYLEKRKQLKRAFLLIDSRVGFKPSDLHLLSLLRPLDLPHQIVMTKVDQVLPPPWRDQVVDPTSKKAKIKSKSKNGAVEDEEQLEQPSMAVLREVKRTLELKKKLAPFLTGSMIPEIIPCSALSLRGHSRRPGPGIEHLRFRMLEACGLEMRLSAQDKSQELKAVKEEEEEKKRATEVRKREQWEREMEEAEERLEPRLKSEKEVLAQHPEIIPFDQLFSGGEASIKSDEVEKGSKAELKKPTRNQQGGKQ